MPRISGRTEQEDFDVLVVGGGPAGCAAALTLLRYSSLRVLVLERSGYTGFRIGESLGPGVLPLLSYLGASQLLSSGAHMPAHGTCAAWGGAEMIWRDFLFTGRGQGWHLDRARFDGAMADRVRVLGGTLFTHAAVESESRSENGGWNVMLRQPKGDDRQIRSRFVIDASGRKAIFARRQGAKLSVYDRLVGVAGVCRLGNRLSRSGFTLVEATPYGWWYSAPLPRERLVAVFMSDADLVRSYQWHFPEQWNHILEASTHTRKRLSGLRLLSKLRVFSANSQLLTPCAGEGWVAAGEAALTFDPLSSGGIGYALLSGIEAARAAAAHLNGDPKLMQSYTDGITRHFQEWRKLRQGYYALESRWRDQCFWSRRS